MPAQLEKVEFINQIQLKWLILVILAEGPYQKRLVIRNVQWSLPGHGGPAAWSI